MVENLQKEIIWNTLKGDVRIRSFCDPAEIKTYTFDEQFGTHAHYKSLFTRRESLEENAGLPDANIVLAVSRINHIIGFSVLAYPETDERWAELEPGIMMEVKALEVARDMRSAKLAHGLIKMMLDHPLIEDKIVYLVGYSWTWDLEGNKLTAQQYRQMMISLFDPFGFQEYQTNEPNICLKPENIFMGRIGKNISPEMQSNFKWLRFGVSP